MSSPRQIPNLQPNKKEKDCGMVFLFFFPLHLFSCNLICVMCECGRGGLKKDERKAVELYRLAADQGLMEAPYTMGRMCIIGKGGIPTDFQRPSNNIDWLPHRDTKKQKKE